MTFPTSPTNNQLHITSNGTLYRYDNTGWSEEESGYITSNFTVGLNQVYLLDSSGSAFTVTLPASADDGDFIMFKTYIGTSTNNITIARNGNTINTTTTDLVLNRDNLEFTLTYNAGDWGINAFGNSISTPGASSVDYVDVVTTDTDQTISSLKTIEDTGLILNRTDGASMSLRYSTSGVRIWDVSKDATEDYVVTRYDASGVLVDTPLNIDFATGNIAIANNLMVTGTLEVDNTSQFDADVTFNTNPILSPADTTYLEFDDGVTVGANTITMNGGSREQFRINIDPSNSLASSQYQVLIDNTTMLNLRDTESHDVVGNLNVVAGGTGAGNLTIDNNLTVSGVTISESGTFRTNSDANRTILVGSDNALTGSAISLFGNNHSTDPGNMFLRYNAAATGVGRFSVQSGDGAGVYTERFIINDATDTATLTIADTTITNNLTVGNDLSVVGLIDIGSAETIAPTTGGTITVSETITTIVPTANITVTAFAGRTGTGAFGILRGGGTFTTTIVHDNTNIRTPNQADILLAGAEDSVAYYTISGIFHFLPSGNTRNSFARQTLTVTGTDTITPAYSANQIVTVEAPGANTIDTIDGANMVEGQYLVIKNSGGGALTINDLTQGSTNIRNTDGTARVMGQTRDTVTYLYNGSFFEEVSSAI